MFHLQQENISITAPIIVLIVFHRRTVVTDSYCVHLPIKISGTLSPSRLFLNHHRILAELFIAPIISHPNPIHLRTNSRVPMVTSQLPRQLHSYHLSYLDNFIPLNLLAPALHPLKCKHTTMSSSSIITQTCVTC